MRQTWLIRHANEQAAEIERLRGEIERLREGEVVEERIQLRAEIERLRNRVTWADGTIAFQREHMIRTAAFLDGLADGPLDAVPIMMKNQDRRPNEEKIYDALRIAAADCRAMAKRLRGET